MTKTTALQGQQLLIQRRQQLHATYRASTENALTAFEQVSAEKTDLSTNALFTPLLANLAAPQTTSPTSQRIEENIKVYPSLLIGMVKHESVAAGRIWLLLRSLDVSGRGWLSIEAVKSTLTDKNSPMRVFGWRRLRQVLQQGGGVYWTRDEHHRLWLLGAAKVATGLAVGRLDGAAVQLPVSALVKGIEATKAAFYAAFHASRSATPITRARLRELLGMSERSQRDYDSVAQVERVRNFDITQVAEHTATQQHTWTYGYASFGFIDYLGKQGEAGCAYNAQRLPNSYHSPLKSAAKGRKSKINRVLKQDLVCLGAQGNSGSKIDQLFYIKASQVKQAIGSDQRGYIKRKEKGAAGAAFNVWLSF